MSALNTIKARVARLEKEQAELGSRDYFLPPEDTYAFWFRLCLFEFAEGNPESVKREVANLHPLELQQIMSLDPEELDDTDAIPAHGIDSSRERVRHVQEIIREAERNMR